MTATTRHPDEAQLLAYGLGGLPAEAEVGLDEHLLGCSECSARLEALATLATGVRAAFRQGRLTSFLSADFVERLRAQGLRLREYRVPRDGSVLCTVTPDDDLVVGRMQAPLADVARVDLVSRIAGQPDERGEDVPFDRARGEVLIAPDLVRLRAMPGHTQRIELFAVAADGATTRLGEYTFNHQAHKPS